MKPLFAVAILSVLGLLLGSAPVKADGFITPSIGANFGGDAGTTLIDAAQDSSKVSYGVAAGWMLNGIFGVEEDFAYAPNFYGHGGGINSSHVLTLMSNALIGVPVGGQHGPGFRPYGSIGLGLINQDVQTPLTLTTFSSNNFGFDAGAGAMGYFSDHFGIRGGVQYFRNFERTNTNAVGLEEGHFSFYRGSVGVVFRF
jgi:hypothetical protein